MDWAADSLHTLEFIAKGARFMAKKAGDQPDPKEIEKCKKEMQSLGKQLDQLRRQLSSTEKDVKELDSFIESSGDDPHAA
jgi:hypothetical protein